MRNYIQLGSLKFDPETNRIIKGEQVQQVEPKLSAVLNYLYINRNRVVKKQQLADAVWKGQVVSDNAISRAISQLRKLLSLADSPQPSIETIPRVGYQLHLEHAAGLSSEKVGQPQQLTAQPTEQAREQSGEQPAEQDYLLERESNQKLEKANVKERTDSKSTHSNRTKQKTSTTKEPFVFDKDSLKVIIFIAFSLAIFARYFYLQFVEEPTPKQFNQSSLTLSPGVEKLPRISPNGKWLAYAAQSESDTSEQLYLIEINSRQVSQLSFSLGYFLDIAWSPDSKSIVYSAWHSPHDRSCKIALVTLAEVMEQSNTQRDSTGTTREQKLLDCSQRSLVKLAWNESGSKIYLSTRASYDRPYFVQSYSLHSQRFEQLTMPPQSGNLRGDYYLAGSASGRHLAVIRYLGTEKSQLQIYATADNQLLTTQLIQGNLSGLTWFGENHLLISRENNLYLYDYQTNQEEFFYSIGKNSGQLSAHFEHQRVAFSHTQRDVNLVEYAINAGNVDNDKRRLLTQSTANEVMPAFSNDKRQLAFISNRTGSNQIWLRNSQGVERQLSQSPASLHYSPLSWSSDDSLVLFQYDGEIFSIAVKDGTIERLIGREHKVANAEWSVDGKSLFYSSEKSGEWQIWQWHRALDQHQQVTRQGGYSVKQDKQHHLYVSRIHQDGLWKLAFKPESKRFSKPVKLLDEFSGTNWLSWKLFNNHIYYFGKQVGDKNDPNPNPNPMGIMQLNLFDQSSRLWFPFSDNQQRYFDISSNALVLTEITGQQGSIQLLEPME